MIIIFFISKKDLLIYLALILLIFLSSTIKFDFIPVGIVVENNDKYIIVDKFLYKEKIYADIEVGTFVYSFNDSVKNDKEDFKYNIFFKSIYKPKIIFKYTPLYLMYKRLSYFSDDTNNILKKTLFNINIYNNQFNIGYGIGIFYIFRLLSNSKNKKVKIISYCLIAVDSILFGFKSKYIFIVLNILFNKFENKELYVVILLLISNPYNISNNTYFLFYLISLFKYLEIKLSFKTFLCIIQSILFNSINLNTFIFKYLIYLRLIYYSFCIITFIFPFFEKTFLFISVFYSKINNILNIELRGKINLYLLFLFMIIIYIFNIKKGYKQLAILFIILIIPINNLYSSVSFIDVGQGDSILIHHQFKNILIDTGSSYNYLKLKKYLYSNGVYKIDYLIITHDDEDHNGNINNLLNDFYVAEIIKDKTDININNLNLLNLDIGSYDSDNDNSLIYYLYINNLSFLFTGDVSSKTDYKYVSLFKDLNIDVLKVAHHGSEYSTSEYLISNMLPKYSIISTNGKYGHPSYRVLNTLTKYYSKILSTKNDGNIRFVFTRFFNLLITDKEFAIIKE